MVDGVTVAEGVRLSSALTLYFGLAVCLLVSIGLVMVFLRMKRIRKDCRETLARRYSSEDIVCHDNLVHFLGSESPEGKKSRGKGVLLLAKNELFFFRLHPKMELCIPLKRIKRIVTPTTFMDISVPAFLLQVIFQEEDGNVTSVAWKVRDVQSFSNSLKLQRKKIQPRKKKV